MRTGDTSVTADTLRLRKEIFDQRGASYFPLDFRPRLPYKFYGKLTDRHVGL
jgi:hypothetical protein